mmetsp:Transcript_61079/g.113313  ORF Transcript_61079/g.113313 Transcript_61079/m.113313 type:complete len:117 (-) Transcript_61079:120-470(-)
MLQGSREGQLAPADHSPHKRPVSRDCTYTVQTAIKAAKDMTNAALGVDVIALSTCSSTVLVVVSKGATSHVKLGGKDKAPELGVKGKLTMETALEWPWYAARMSTATSCGVLLSRM